MVTEKTPFVGNIIGVSGFGITNAFSHVILKKSQQKKTTPTTVALPQLILVSGRNEKNAIETIQKVNANLNILLIFYAMKCTDYVIRLQCLHIIQHCTIFFMSSKLLDSNIQKTNHSHRSHHYFKIDYYENTVTNC